MISVENMTVEDINQVVIIEQSIFSEPWSFKSFEDSLKNQNTIYLVAKDDEEVVGYCGIYISFFEGNISNVAVRKDKQRQHIAERMLNKLIQESQKKGVKDITLEVRETNISAIILYEKLGFKESGIRKGFYDKPKENALIMWKHNL